MNNRSKMKLFSLLSESSQVTTEQMQQAYPKNPKQVKSQIYFIPKPKECSGIDSMGEFAVSFEFSRQFINEKGQPIPVIHKTLAWKRLLTLPLEILTNLKKEY